MEISVLLADPSGNITDNREGHSEISETKGNKSGIQTNCEWPYSNEFHHLKIAQTFVLERQIESPVNRGTSAGERFQVS